MSDNKYTKKNIIDILQIVQIVYRNESDLEYKQKEEYYIEKYKKIIENIDDENFVFEHSEISDIVEFKNELVKRRNDSSFFIKTDFSDSMTKSSFMESHAKGLSDSDKIKRKKFMSAKNKATKSFINKIITLEDGKDVLKFEIVEFISSGSFGLVFKCNVYKNKLRMLDQYAMKIVFCSNQDLMINSEGEVTLQSMISSGYVMEVHYAFKYVMEDVSYPLFISVSDLMDGDLDILFKNYDNINKIDIMRKVAKGLFDIHKYGIIHRDLKPGNILFKIYPGVTVHVKITDFGASVLETETLSNDYNHTTEPYTSPEQLKCRKISFTHDVWSLGVIINKLYTGMLPFNPDIGDNGDSEKALLDLQIKSIVDFESNETHLVEDEVLNNLLMGIFKEIPIERPCLNTIINELQ